MRRQLNPIRNWATTLPDRTNNPLPAGCDEERRRFLRQIATGTFSLALALTPRLVAADDLWDESAPSEVDEDRTIWLEEGYIISIRWRRPAIDLTPVEALERAIPAVRTFLTENVVAVEDLHNIDRLRALERSLAALLGPLTEPAGIIVVHIDHDCSRICSVAPSRSEYPKELYLLGEKPMPHWK